jgi:hypothetical protein
MNTGIGGKSHPAREGKRQALAGAAALARLFVLRAKDQSRVSMFDGVTLRDDCGGAE